MRSHRNFKTNRCYHLLSRIANRAFYLDDDEKTLFVERLWRVARFSCVEVLAYCFMSNHFHILIYIPDPYDLSDDELWMRIRTLYSGPALAEIEKEWELLTKVGGEEGKDRFRKRYFRRMWNASEFMKTLKQDATMSYNGRRFHSGTIWESRFRVRMCEPEEKTELMNIAGYIDRNPVKAKIVVWPDKYEWCSFAAACKGDRRCIDGYRFIYSVFSELPGEMVRGLHEKSIHLVLKELEEEKAAGGIRRGLSVNEEKRQKSVRKAYSDFEVSVPRMIPRVLERGNNRIAFDILKMLSSTDAMSPAALRAGVGITSANFFTSRYLTPLAKSGYIRLSRDAKRFSRTKTYELTAQGREILSCYPHHSIPTTGD